MLIHVRVLCDGCGDQFDRDPDALPISLSSEDRDCANKGKHVSLVALLCILEVDHFEFCTTQCRSRAVEAINAGLIFNLRHAAGELLRGVGKRANAEAEKAAALQRPDPVLQSPSFAAVLASNLAQDPEHLGPPAEDSLGSDPPVKPMGGNGETGERCKFIYVQRDNGRCALLAGHAPGGHQHPDDIQPEKA